jgi:chromosomal replication initiation ATPase DnaA
MIEQHTHPAVQEIIKSAAASIQQIIGKAVVIDVSELVLTYSGQNLNTENMARLKNIICDVCAVSWEEIEGKSRQRPISIARFFYCLYGRTFLHLTHSAIGRSINRDHTTVLHAVNAIEDLLHVRDAEVVKKNNQIKTQLFKEHETEINEVGI